MLTNNFYKMLYTSMTQKTLTNEIVTTTNNLQNSAFDKPNYGMPSFNYYFFTSFFSKTVSTSTNDKNVVAFGTGSTPPSVDDYWLSGDLITGISIVAQGITRANTEGGVGFTNKLTVENTGSDTIVINEMAIIARCYYNASSYDGPAMVDRTVLDTPLTLAPGEQGTIDYTFNLPIVQ